MGRLIYTLNLSLDGYVEAPGHDLSWTVVDDELHTWFNEHHRTLGASLYGRRLYELMSSHWPTADSDPSATDAMREYARIWRATPRIVFSSTLTSVEHNSRLARGDIAEELARVRQEFDGDLEVGGATLAASFIRRGLVDEYWLLVHPVAIGSGTPYFPRLDAPLRLRLVESRTFRSGVIYLRYLPAD